MDAISVSFSSENTLSGSSMSISSVGSMDGAPSSDVFSSSNLDFDSLSIHNDGAEPTSTVPSPPLGDAFALGAVLKLSRSGWSRCYSYALYCGNGRVIHSWSNMRTHFRVRIDSLRSLATAGVTTEDATEELDAFCAKVLGSTPLPPREIVTRAREALHCKTHGRRCSVVLIVHARYGTVATSMAKSLLTIAPLVIKLNGLGAQFSNGQLSMRDALGVVLHYIDPKNYLMPPDRPAPAAEAGEPQPTVAVPLKTVLLAKARQMNAIDGLLRSDIAPFLAAWIMIALKKGDPNASTVAVVIALLKRAKASLFFSPMAKAFTIVLSSDANLLERLVRERMECGICFVNYNDVPTKLLECSHVLCGNCFASLRTRVCPYCREPITFERQITNHYKALANETIREHERLEMEANDVDAPPCLVSPPSSTGAELETGRGPVSSLLAIRAALARALSLDDDDDDLTAILQLEEDEKRESADMASEDADAHSA